ncbi:hypothetical protein GOBAR_DD14955 [Gossypium barbadense]|nr:hypothetical protein GOBAR_DD14955 [Gossypium barbadense]
MDDFNVAFAVDVKYYGFRGEDTRYGFISHLYDEISDALLKAIEEWRVSVIVFSKGYASSIWCLEEMVKIMDCKINNHTFCPRTMHAC